MIIRIGAIEDFKQLNQEWAWSGEAWQRAAQKKAIQSINKEDQEFWVIETDTEIIGELHIAWSHKDPDHANMYSRAYLFALRIHPNHRAQGLGTKLMARVLERVKAKGFNEVTIGAYKEEAHLKIMYEKWGFTEFIKDVTESNLEYTKVFELFLQSL